MKLFNLLWTYVTASARYNSYLDELRREHLACCKEWDHIIRLKEEAFRSDDIERIKDLYDKTLYVVTFHQARNGCVIHELEGFLVKEGIPESVRNSAVRVNDVYQESYQFLTKALKQLYEFVETTGLTNAPEE